MKQKWISGILALAMVFQIAGCASAPPAPSSSAPSSSASSASSPAAPSAQPDDGQEGRTAPLPAVGDVIAGFTLERIDPYPPLNADILAFRHPVSGAQLCYIKNDDTNRAFSIAYRTPHVDEADVNHVFEHAVIASSDKYPSNNLFFDLIGKTYNTYCNASTYLPFTMYPVGSQSEEQLLKMADAYLSCMVDPGVLKDERFFQREALRYMLYDVEDPITMGGTVFSEDMGYMTNSGQKALSNIMKALYPGEYASNMNGRAFLNYKDLTYEHMKATYDCAYHFDNSLLLLYGDLDYRSFLAFLDSEYLSKAEDSQTDLSAYEDPKTAPGYVEKVAYSPAYEGDATEDVSIISYVMDLDGQSWETMYQYEFLAALLSSESSVFHENLKSAGLISPAYAAMDNFEEKPFFPL